MLSRLNEVMKNIRMLRKLNKIISDKTPPKRVHYILAISNVQTYLTSFAEKKKITCYFRNQMWFAHCSYNFCVFPLHLPCLCL